MKYSVMYFETVSLVSKYSIIDFKIFPFSQPIGGTFPLSVMEYFKIIYVSKINTKSDIVIYFKIYI